LARNIWLLCQRSSFGSILGWRLVNNSYDHQTLIGPVVGENQFWSIMPLASRI
jgi:hypothetical protein